MTGQTIYFEFAEGQAQQVDRINTNPTYDLGREYALAAADPQWSGDHDAAAALGGAQYDILDD